MSMSERRPTAQIMSMKKCEQLITILRADSAKNEFICKVVEQALRSCGISDRKITPAIQSRVLNYIWNAPNIPEHDKPYAIAKIQYCFRS